MARRYYRAWNAATAAATASPTPVATGTTIKTMLQWKPTVHTPVIGYGFRLESIPTAVVKLDVLTTGTVNATVTAFAAGDILNFDPLGPASTATLATSGSGYTSTGEGTITSSRMLDSRLTWDQSLDIQFPLDREYACGPLHYLRLRVTTATSVNMLCYFDLEE